MAGAELRAAIGQVYANFAAIPCPRRLHASPLREADAILRALTSGSLAALPESALAPYSRWAITTVGTEQEFRHLLPRILELAATDPGWTGAEPPVIADRIGRSGWVAWTPAERASVAALFAAAFAEALEQGPGAAICADDWLCGMALLGLELAAPLARWRADRSGEAALALAIFVLAQGSDLRDGRGVARGHWENVSPAVQAQAGAWLSAPESVVQLRAAGGLLSPEDRWEIGQALSVLVGLT